MLKVFSVLAFITCTFLLNGAAGQACATCPTDYSTCITATIGSTNITASCTCYENYLTCLQSQSGSLCTIYLNSFAGTCPAEKSVCPSLICPTSTDPCTNCQATFSGCAVSSPTSACTCVTPWLQCLSTNSCPGAAIICGSYAGLCPTSLCTASPCGSCLGSFSQCVEQNPLAPCPCMNTLQGCIGTCGVGVSEYDVTCPIYQTQCPSIVCNTSSTLTGCPKCAVDAYTCALNSINTGASGVCTCLSSLYTCLTGSTCGLTAFSGMCGTYSGLCPSIQCTGGKSQLASQVLSVLKNYQPEVESFLQRVLNGTNITFGTYTTVGNTQIIDFVAIFPNNIEIDVFFADFKSQFSLYFNIDVSLVTVQYGNIKIKRDQSQSAQVIVQSPSSSASSVSSLGIGILAALAIAAIFI